MGACVICDFAFAREQKVPCSCSYQVHVCVCRALVSIHSRMSCIATSATATPWGNDL